MEKAIREMASLMCEGCADHGDCKYDICDATLDEARRFYDEGYRKVVLCDDCVLQGQCIVEDAFNTARMADSKKFCAIGKRRRESNDKR